MASFQRSVVRGLAILMPPLLTIILFIWAWNTIDAYVLAPVEGIVRRLIVAEVSDVFTQIPADVDPGDMKAKDGRVVEFQHRGKSYVPLQDGQWVPKDHYAIVMDHKRRFDSIPANAFQFYERYVDLEYLQRHRVIPVFLLVFVLTLYVLGKLMAFSVGRMLWNAADWVLHKLPLIRNVYGSVKQVTDLLFGERQDVRFTRVVAVEYPRKGIWSMAFVTGESFVDLREAAGEPVVAVLIPTSPMPATGFAVTMRKSEVVDLNITIDQALQFIVSCGVVAPPYKWPPQGSDAKVVDGHIGAPSTTAAPKLSEEP